MYQDLIEQIYSIVTELECKTLVRLGDISLVIFYNVLGDYGELLSKRDIYVYDNETYLGSIYDECNDIYYDGFNTIDKQLLLKSIIEQLSAKQEK